MSGPLRRIGRVVRRAAPWLVLVLVACALWCLHTIVEWPIEVLVGVGLGGLVVYRFFAAPVALIIGAALVPILALMGANWLWAKADFPHVDRWVGLVFAAVLVGLFAWAYFGSWWVKSRPRRPWAWALLVLGVALVPPLVAQLAQPTNEGDALPDEALVSGLDVVLVRDGEPLGLADTQTVDRWKIRYSQGRATGRTVDWDRGRLPEKAKDAERVLVLAILEPEGQRDIKRWLAIADGVSSSETPTLVMLRTEDLGLVDRWSTEINQDEGRPGQRPGVVFPVQELDPSRIGDLALKVAVEAPTAEADLTLAARHRPAILFDSGERYRTPLNVDTVLESGAMRLCPNDQPGVAQLCTEVDESSDLRNGSNHLEFDTDAVDEKTRDSLETTVYVNVTHRTAQGTKRIYLDYWWYLVDNPSYAADGALCGEGFIIIGVACFDHQSDWEGVTVVLDAEAEPPSPVAVHYAAHKFVTRYGWPTLSKLWAGTDSTAPVKGIDTTLRPLVFVAQGSHASYPRQCTRSTCKQPGGVIEEERYNGRRGWLANDEVGCALACLVALPTSDRGKEAARWNAYTGLWGSSDCDFLFFCSSSKAPQAPGAQDRYAMPWCVKKKVLKCRVERAVASTDR